MNREAIYSTLFARVAAAAWPAIPISGATTWVSASRKLLGWGDVDAGAMPAIFQTQVSEKITRQPNKPAIYTLMVEWRIYVAHLANTDNSVIPTMQLNPIMDAVQKCMEPIPSDRCAERNTLGGLVYDCKMVGEIKDFEGDLGDIGVLLVPVEIIVPF